MEVFIPSYSTRYGGRFLALLPPQRIDSKGSGKSDSELDSAPSESEKEDCEAKSKVSMKNEIACCGIKVKNLASHLEKLNKQV